MALDKPHIRVAALILCFALLSSQAFAEEPKGYSVDLLLGTAIDTPTLTGSALDFIPILLSIRTGPVIDFEASLGSGFGAGVEAGLMYMTWTLAGGEMHLIDMPIRAKASFTHKWFKTEVFAGSLLALVTLVANGSLLDLGLNPLLDAGGRIAFGPVYLEASYVFRMIPTFVPAFPRFGLGACLPLVK